MAIKTVTNANLAEYVAERTAGGSKIATGEEQVAQADAQPKVEGTATPGNPVIKPGVAETLNAGPDPGNATPTAKTSDKTPVQARIDELTRLRKEAEEFAEDEYAQRLRAEARIAELEGQLKTSKPPEVPKPEELKRPSPKDFTDQDQYDAAMEEYDRKRDERTRAAALAEGEQRAFRAEQARVMNQRITAAKAALPDYEEVLQAAANRTTVVPPHIQAAFLEDENGAFIAYELAKDAALEKRIFSLSPAKALLELGKINLSKYATPGVVTTTTTPATPTPETTRAPAPLTTVRGGDGDVSKDLTKPMPFNEYKAARLEKLRAERRRH